MPHPQGRSPHRLRRRRHGQDGRSFVHTDTDPVSSPPVILHVFSGHVLGQEGAVSGDPRQYACITIYDDPAEAREARARLERAATS
jgi:hypothetical protein